jgi:hypothetical protein
MTTMTQPEPGGRVQLYRPATGAIEWVSVPEAARAMIALGRATYGEGTPGFAATVMRAVEMLAEHGLTPGGELIGGTS